MPINPHNYAQAHRRAERLRQSETKPLWASMGAAIKTWTGPSKPVAVPSQSLCAASPHHPAR